MADLKLGRQSFRFREPPVIGAWAAVGGRKEGDGPLGRQFDTLCRDPYFGQDTWEQGEKAMQQTALRRLLRKAGKKPEDLGPVLSGDLLNQCVCSALTMKNTGIPHLGLYGACSTMAESLVLGAALVGGGFVSSAAAMTSSHFCASERQYRFPLGYGGQRTPTSQWTVTGAGAVLIQGSGTGPRIRSCTLGTVRDLGIRDPSNMGSAMAPAACSTLLAHFRDLGTGPEDYDRIYTGDLGKLGRDLLLELCAREGTDLGDRLEDCGCMIYDLQTQNVGCGGSGCGCSAAVLCTHILERLRTGTLQRVLFCGTGALLSPLTTQQGLSIPGICHAVELTAS